MEVTILFLLGDVQQNQNFILWEDKEAKLISTRLTLKKERRHKLILGMKKIELHVNFYS